MMGKKIKTLRSDNGGEYIDGDFTDFCAKEGIKREWIAPYNPKQNGVVERKNRTIVGATKAMLFDLDLPRYLSVEACNTIVYIQNRTPHRALRKKTHEEVFTGKKPEVGHLRIFGSMAYCHVPSEKRSKLDQTAEREFLVGYNEVSKAYRIYIPSSRKVVIRRDVKFMEDRALQKSCDMPIEDQTAEVPLVQEQDRKSVV